MGEYTLFNDVKLDLIIENDIKTIVEELKHEFNKNIYSIVLTGGYGRGEGGVQIKNNQNIPKNNYDILLVLKKTGIFNYKRLKTQLAKFESNINKSKRLANLLDITLMSKLQTHIPIHVFEIGFTYSVFISVFRLNTDF